MPPDEWGGGPTAETANHHRLPNTTRHHPSGISDGSTAGQRRHGYAMAWRHGFGRGFRDALRLAGRRLPPECWSVLDELASDYELAGSDD